MRHCRRNTWSSPATGMLLATLMLSACSMTAQVRRNTQLRHELDGTPINKPLAEVWPVALHLLADHGHELVGRDREVIGAEPAAVYKQFTAGGFETGHTDHGLVMETMTDVSGVSYRAEGTDLDGKHCRVTFIAIQRTHSAPSEEKTRDLDLELELVQRVDPEQASRMAQAADAAAR